MTGNANPYHRWTIWIGRTTAESLFPNGVVEDLGDGLDQRATVAKFHDLLVARLRRLWPGIEVITRPDKSDRTVMIDECGNAVAAGPEEIAEVVQDLFEDVDAWLVRS